MGSNNKNYGLYQTFNENLPTKNLSKSKKTILLERIEKADLDQTEAIFMLVCEHDRLTNEEDECDEVDIPYDGIQKRRGVKFDLDKFPIELVWIIWKFCEVIQK